MLPIIVLAGVLAVLWRLSYWPFDRSYKFLPKFGETQHAKIAPPSGPKPTA